MYSEPWARLIMSMMPNTSVRPAASRNNIKPNCRPLSACSSTRMSMIASGPGRSVRGHLAGRRVGVGLGLEDGAQRPVGDAALRVAADHAQVVVLHREVVAVELEGAAHRFEPGCFERLAQRGLVVELALDIAHRGVYQARRVVALEGVQR